MALVPMTRGGLCEVSPDRRRLGDALSDSNARLSRLEIVETWPEERKRTVPRR